MQKNYIACRPERTPNRQVHYMTPGGGFAQYTGTFLFALDRPAALTGLAQFLAENVINTSRQRGALVVRCYNDNMTIADQMREEKPGERTENMRS